MSISESFWDSGWRIHESLPVEMVGTLAQDPISKLFPISGTRVVSLTAKVEHAVRHGGSPTSAKFTRARVMCMGELADRVDILEEARERSKKMVL